jgi:hypothetical protein
MDVSRFGPVFLLGILCRPKFLEPSCLAVNHVFADRAATLANRGDYNDLQRVAGLGWFSQTCAEHHWRAIRP